jgi:UDP-glucuronate decarboxylase
MTMSELGHLVISLTGSRSRIEFRPLPQDDPRQRRPDIARALQLLHWTPKVTLEEGLNKTIAYFDALLAHPSEADKLVWKFTQ